MKKCLIFIIFLILLENVILEDICMGSTLDINDCIGKLSQDKKDANCYCCLFTGTSKEGYQVSQCIELQKIQYDFPARNLNSARKSCVQHCGQLFAQILEVPNILNLFCK